MTLRDQIENSVVYWLAVSFASGVVLVATVATLFGLEPVRRGSYVMKDDLAPEYLPRETVERDYVSQASVRVDYIRKADVAAAYVARSEIESTYLRRDQVQRDFVARSSLAARYVPRSEVDSHYLPRTELAARYLLKSDCRALAVRSNSNQDVTEHCDSAIFSGWVCVCDPPAQAWYEWGETRALGNTTERRAFIEHSDFLQHLDGLKEDTTYYHRIVVSSGEHLSFGRILAFRTPKCVQ